MGSNGPNTSLKLPATSLAWRHWDMLGVRGARFFVRRTDVENCVVYRCKQLNNVKHIDTDTHMFACKENRIRLRTGSVD